MKTAAQIRKQIQFLKRFDWYPKPDADAHCNAQIQAFEWVLGSDKEEKLEYIA